MIDVFELWLEFIGMVNTQQGGHVRPNLNFLQWVNAISMLLYEKKFEDWEKSQKIVDDLSRPFLKSANVSVKAVNGNYGVAAFPDDYVHFSSARYYTLNDKVVPAGDLEIYDHCGKKLSKDEGAIKAFDADLWEVLQAQKKARQPKLLQTAMTEIPVDMVSNDRWGSILNHLFHGPTMTKPKMTQYGQGFKVAPAGINVIILDYLRMPNPATFEYSVIPADPNTGQGDYLVYDEQRSKKLEWSLSVKHEIMTMLRKYYGNYVREDFGWQTAESDRRNNI